MTTHITAAELEAHELMSGRRTVSSLGFDRHVKQIRDDADFIIELAERIKSQRQVAIPQCVTAPKESANDQPGRHEAD